jgi:DNA mismatch repair ATPase MutL
MEVYLSFLKTYIFGKWYNYILLAVLCLLLVSNIVLFICFFTLKRNKKKRAHENNEIKSDYGLSVKRAVEKVITAEETPQVFSGYVDVGYIKTLISSLKTNSLTDAEIQDLEEFEVYLLNFVNRQPNNTERQELSSKLGALIKTLSKYA